MRIKEYLTWKKRNLTNWFSENGFVFTLFGKAATVIFIQALPFILLFKYAYPHTAPPMVPTDVNALVLGILCSLLLAIIEGFVWLDYDDFKYQNPEKIGDN